MKITAVFGRLVSWCDTASARWAERVHRRQVLAALIGLVGLAYGYEMYWVGFSQFSPDSWSYHELSKTVFSGDFFRFNTFRSFSSEKYSISFPLGYPVALALVQFVSGTGPESALVLNLLIVLASPVVVIMLTDALALPRVHGVAIATALVLYPPYMSEVVSGRSVPLAILMFAIAGLCYARAWYFYFGLFLGISALVRFDFLSHSLILVLALWMAKENDWRVVLRSVAGLIVGLIPWVFYSEFHFGKIWASDNSWVALSALPAFVMDFPAAPVVSIQDDPLGWWGRIGSNIPPLGLAVFRAISGIPIVLVALIFLLLRHRGLAASIRIHGYRKPLVFLVAIAAALGPYLLTGYFDVRYYAIHVVCFSLVLIGSLRQVDGMAGEKCYGSLVMSLALVLSLCAGIIQFCRISHNAEITRPTMLDELGAIQRLYACHQRQPGLTYLIDGSAGVSYFRYGALTGKKTSGLPSNFSRMNEKQRKDFLSLISPYSYIREVSKGSVCPSVAAFPASD